VAVWANRCANLHGWILLSTLMGVKLVMVGAECDKSFVVNPGRGSRPILGEAQGLASGFPPENLI
jgi:hypothetical protein